MYQPTTAKNNTKRDLSAGQKILQIFEELSSYYADDYMDKYTKRQYYYNKQFSKTETIEYGQATNFHPVPINVVRPTIDQMTAILTSDRPTFKVLPINEKDKFGSYVMNDMLFGFAAANKYDSIHRRDVRDCLCTGIAWNRLSVSQTSDQGLFGVSLEKIPFWMVLPDPRVTQADFSDMRKCIVFDYKPLSYLLEVTGLSMDDFRDDCVNIGDTALQALFKDSTIMQNDIFSLDSNPMILCIDYYEQKAVDKYKVETLDYNVRVEYKLPLFLSLVELDTIRANDAKFQNLIDKNIIQIKKEKRNTVFLESYVGMYKQKKVDIQISDIPVTPLVYDFDENVLNIHGEIHYIQSLQDAINKCFKLTLANASFSAVGRLLYQEDAVDPAKVEKWLSGEITALAYTKKNIQDKEKPVEFYHGSNIDTGFYQLYQDLFAKTEYMTGLYSILMGDASKAPDVFSTVSAMEEFGTQRIKNVARSFTDQRARQGKIALQYLQHFASITDVVRYISDTGEKTDMPTFIPEFNDAANIINVLLDLSVVEFDVRNLSQPNFGTTRINKANMMNTFLTQHNVPPSQHTIGTMAKLLDLPELDDVAKDLDIQNQKAQLQQELEKVNKMNQDLEKQLLKSKTNMKVKDAEVALEKILNKIEAETHISTSDLKMYIKQVEKDLDAVVNEQEQKSESEEKPVVDK
jgi:hypothetical protein